MLPKAGPKPKKSKPKKASTEENKATALWGEYVHVRDVVCQACGRATGKLDAHHMIPRSYKAVRADETNGVLLCVPHHTGRDGCHNDPEFAMNLYAKVLGVPGWAALRAKARAGVGKKYPAEFWIAEQDRLKALLAGLREGITHE
jgi:hypothetical protein